MNTASPARLARRWDVRILALAILVQLFLLFLYFAVAPEYTTTPRYTLYPLVWITVSLWVAMTVDVPDASGRRQLVGAAIAAVYFAVLLYLSGLVGFSPSEQTLASGGGFAVDGSSPGWERVTYVTESFYVVFVTYRVLGYLVLAYLVYVTVLDASASFFSGALGLFSCVSCTFPVLLSLSAGLFGGAVAGAVLDFSFDLGTLFFIVALTLLYYRPGFGRVTA